MVGTDSAIIYCGGLLDGTGTPGVLDAAIRVESGKVKAVGPAAALAPQPGEYLTEYDFRGLWITPGLIDEHTHLSLPMGEDGRSYEQMALDPDELMVMKGVQNLQRNLAAGVTSVRDNGARNRVGFIIREGIRLGYVPGPRVLACGRPITATGGHFHWCNEQADGEEEIRKAVRRLVHEGADHIKIMASGGGTAGTIPGRASYSTAELRAAAEESHALGRLTTAHCRAKESMLRAVSAGINLVEHAEFLDADGTARFDPQLAEMMRDAGVWICPTLQASCNWRGVQALEAKRDADGLSQSEEARLGRMHEQMSMRLDIFRRMLDAGLMHRMVSGSDTGGGRLIYDLELMVRGGMTPSEVLQAATRVSAEAIGLGDQLGTLAPGRVADLIAVEGDPSEDISALGRVRAVFQAGYRVV